MVYKHFVRVPVQRKSESDQPTNGQGWVQEMPIDASEICDKICDFVKGKTSKKKLYCYKLLQIIQPEELNIQQIIVKPDIIILNYMRSEASKYLLALTIT